MPTVEVECKFPKKRYAVLDRILIAGAKKAVDGVIRSVKKDMRAVTRTWSTPIKIDIKRARSVHGDIIGSISTRDKRFVMLDLGTPAHFVPRGGSARMKVKRYKAKTYPGVLRSWSGGVSKVTYRVGRWKVRGIRPRKFLKAMTGRGRIKLLRLTLRVLKDAMR